MNDFDDVVPEGRQATGTGADLATALASMIDRFGPSLFFDPARVGRMLNEACPDAARDIALVVTALVRNVPQRLIAAHDDAALHHALSQSIGDLTHDAAFDRASAMRTVRLWAGALALPTTSLDGTRTPARRDVAAPSDFASVVTPLNAAGTSARQATAATRPPSPASSMANAPRSPRSIDDAPATAPAPPVKRAAPTIDRTPATPAAVGGDAAPPRRREEPMPPVDDATSDAAWVVEDDAPRAVETGPARSPRVAADPPDSPPTTAAAPAAAGRERASPAGKQASAASQPPAVAVGRAPRPGPTIDPRPSTLRRARLALAVTAALALIVIVAVVVREAVFDRPVPAPTASAPPAAPVPPSTSSPPPVANPTAAASAIAPPAATPDAASTAAATAPAPVPVDLGAPTIARIEAPQAVVGKPFDIVVAVAGSADAVASVERRVIDGTTRLGREPVVTPAMRLRRSASGALLIPFDGIDVPSRAMIEFVLVDEAGARSPPDRIELQVVAAPRLASAAASKSASAAASRSASTAATKSAATATPKSAATATPKSASTATKAAQAAATKPAVVAATKPAPVAATPTRLPACVPNRCGSVVSVREVDGDRTTYEAIVRMDDRSIQTLRQATRWRVGTRVEKVDNRYVPLGGGR